MSSRLSKATASKEVLAVLGICLGIAILIVLLYMRVSGDKFIYCDDDQYVFQNPVVQQGLTLEGVKWAFLRSHAANWHPLTWISHMIDVEFFGLNAGSHHLVSVALHALNAVLLFLALRLMTGAFWASVVTALLFAVHPLRVESVAWVAERKDVLSGTFFMLTLLAYAGYTRRPGPGRYLLVLVLMALGLMAKPMLVTLPFVLLLLDIWPIGRWNVVPNRRSGVFKEQSLSRLILEKVPLLFLSIASSAATLWSQKAGGAMGNMEILPFAARVSNAATSYCAYLWKTLWPTNLAIFYPHPALVRPEAYSPLNTQAVGAGLFLIAITFLVIRKARKRPYFFTGWFWYMGMLVPVIGLVQVGEQARADRYAYLPLIGIYLIVVWGMREWAGHISRAKGVLAAVTPVLLTAYMALAWHQTGYWRDSRRVFEHAVRVTANNYFAYNHLGRAFENSGHLTEAAEAYNQAVQIKPNYTGAHSNLGSVLGKLGKYKEAVAHFKRALSIDPGFADGYNNLGVVYGMMGRSDEAIAAYEKAVALNPDTFQNQFNLGSELAKKGEADRALPHLERAVALNPLHANAANNLGVAYLRLGRIKQAEAVFKKVLILAPEHPDAACNLGLVYERSGRPSDAEAAYRHALECNPDCAPAHRFLSYKFIREGKLDEAAAHLEQLVRILPASADAHNDLGTVYARSGKFERARVQFEQALSIDPSHAAARRNLAQLTADLKKRGQ